MPLLPTVSTVIPNDWNSVITFNKDTQRVLHKLTSLVIGPAATPTFSSITLSGLTASHLIAADADKTLSSVTSLSSWVAGTANEINVADDGDGTITIGLVDPLIAGKGGTGAATLTDHGILLGSGTDAVTPLGAATNGQLPIGSTGADPVLAALTGTSNRVTVTNGAGTITLSGPQDLHTGASPTFTGLTVGTLAGVLKATAGVVAGSAVHSDLGSIGANDHHNQAHVLNGADHTVSGLTTGHVLQATGATTFGFAAVPGLHDAVTLSSLSALTLTGQQLSLTSGYIIPTTTEESNWNTAYDHSQIAAGDSVHVSTTENTNWDTAYSHSQLVSGNPHSVTPTELGLLIGTNTQAWDADLDAIAALAKTDSNFIVGNGTTWVAESGATVRTSLGLGTGDSPQLSGAKFGVSSLRTFATSGFTPVVLTEGSSGGTSSMAMVRNGASVNGPVFEFGKTRAASAGGVTIVADGDTLGGMYFTGADGVALVDGARIEAKVDGTPGVNDMPGRLVFSTASGGSSATVERMRVSNNGYVSIGTLATANEKLEVAGKIRANTAFNLNGTDGVTQAASAGKVNDVTALAGGIATAQTQITYAADGTYANPTSITVQNGRITAIS